MQPRLDQSLPRFDRACHPIPDAPFRLEGDVRRLVILPVEKGETIEVRLAWEVIAGSSLAWTVYIDAMSGEDLRVVQNFNT